VIAGDDEKPIPTFRLGMSHFEIQPGGRRVWDRNVCNAVPRACDCATYRRCVYRGMYGNPFIELSTGRRLRTFTDVHARQPPFLARIRSMWRACRATDFGFIISAPDPAVQRG
jgi:hypothetical protein